MSVSDISEDIVTNSTRSVRQKQEYTDIKKEKKRTRGHSRRDFGKYDYSEKKKGKKLHLTTQRTSIRTQLCLLIDF